MRILAPILLSLSTLLSGPLLAKSYDLPKENSKIVGQPTYYVVDKRENLQQIADSLDVGFLGIHEANPSVDPFLPTIGSRLIVPDQLILPDVPREGIVINLAELRLYYFTKEKVYVFPVGIGRVGRETPLMETYIIAKQANPTWTPTASIRKEHLAKGDPLPAVVAAGPNNPLGLFKLRMAYGHGEYLIHGTNKNFGIGLRVSHGCIRLAAPNIEWLYHNIPLKTKVRIINDPIKVSVEPDGSKWIEVHTPLSTEENTTQNHAVLTEKIKLFLKGKNINQKLVKNVLDRQAGLPIKISLSTQQPKKIEMLF